MYTVRSYGFAGTVSTFVYAVLRGVGGGGGGKHWVNQWLVIHKGL